MLGALTLGLLACTAATAPPGPGAPAARRARGGREAVGLFAQTAKPAVRDAGPDRPVELGVKFRVDVTGEVVGIRFHKAPANAGGHLASLWTGSGELLAQASSRTETPSGWQQVLFPAPIAVEPGRVYVASYHARAGHFSVDHGFFAARGVDRAPLHAPADGVEGANGVFGYGPAGTFPTQGHRSSNYWVDVLFRPGAGNELRSIEVDPGLVTLGPGDGRRLTATGRYADGRARDLTALVRWTSDEAAIAVSGAGEVKASGPGAAAVRATLGEISGAAAVIAVSPSSGEELTRASVGDPAELSVRTMALPDAMLGVSYSASLDASGGAEPYRWAAVGGMPPGLELDGATGVIAGRPAAIRVLPLHVVVTDAEGRAASASVRLAVGPPSFGLWPPDLAVIATDPAPARATEAGVRFRSAVAGHVTAIRIHREVAGASGRTVHLWSGQGVLLAEARSAPAAERGWQVVPLPRPVPIEAGAGYVASYRLEGGRPKVTAGYFDRGVVSPPLRVDVGTPVDVGGVFAFEGALPFPTEAHAASNPWVDVVFVPSVVPPALVSIRISPGSPGIELGEPQPLRAVGLDSRGEEFDLTRVVRWESSDPSAVRVAADGTATGRRAGGAQAVARFRGVEGATSVTARPLPPAPDEGPGGPLLVLTGSANGFSRYLVEILRAEGLNEFLATDLSRLDADLLERRDLVILGDLPLTDAQAELLAGWVRAGGNLIAMRPDARLAGLFGLRRLGGTLEDGDFRVVEGPGPGAGITTRPMQFHGPADLYALAGASAVALLDEDGKPTAHPALALHLAGRGRVAAFAFDLARSIVYTRQGNPEWSGQPRSGGTPRRPHDLFYGNAPFDPRPDWVDFSRIDLPQADEQQRLLVNLVLRMNEAKRPLPRLWYLPSGHRAAVVLTGDDHAQLGPAPRLDQYLASSRPGCSVEDWECVRATAYVYPSSPLTAADAQRYLAQGFEISLHVTTECADFGSRADLEAVYATQLSALSLRHPGLPRPRTIRAHCVAWSDYDTQPKVQAALGIRLDTDYYYWPASWVKDRPGFMTGSALPMRFSDRAGRILDVYQLATQMTDESGQSYPATVERLLDGALGPPGNYGFYTANLHSDEPTSKAAVAVVAAARARGVPVISALQLLEWLEARDGSSFSSLEWDGSELRFTLHAAPGARNLRAMLPARVGSARLRAVARDGAPVPFEPWTVKGVPYALFPAEAGEYAATYR